MLLFLSNNFNTHKNILDEINNVEIWQIVLSFG